MSSSNSSFGEKLKSKAKRGAQGYPLATIVYYGPDASKATKVVVGIINSESAEPDPLERWHSESRDVRTDFEINKSIYYQLLRHAVKSVVIADRIMAALTKKAATTRKGRSVRNVLTGPSAIGFLVRFFSEPYSIHARRSPSIARLAARRWLETSFIALKRERPP